MNMLLLLTTNLIAQVDSGLILTQEQNDKWFERFGQLGLKDQIETLNKRILMDTNVFVTNTLDRLVIEKVNRRQVGFCKPMMLIGGVLISIENRTQTSDIKYLTTLLTAETVKKIEIIKEDQASALFGQRGICKGLNVTITSKRTKRKLETLEPKMYSPTVTKEIRWRH